MKSFYLCYFYFSDDFDDRRRRDDRNGDRRDRHEMGSSDRDRRDRGGNDRDRDRYRHRSKMKYGKHTLKNQLTNLRYIDQETNVIVANAVIAVIEEIEAAVTVVEVAANTKGASMHLHAHLQNKYRGILKP